MKKIILFILLLSTSQVFAAPLTPGKLIKADVSQKTADSIMTELSGNIGVSTTQPAALLDVHGNIILTGASPVITAGRNSSGVSLPLTIGGAINGSADAGTLSVRGGASISNHGGDATYGGGDGNDKGGDTYLITGLALNGPAGNILIAPQSGQGSLLGYTEVTEGNFGIGTQPSSASFQVVGKGILDNVLDNGLTASRPVISDGSKNLASGSYSGNTTTLATTSGSLTNGHAVTIDASGNLVDSGSSPLATSGSNLLFGNGSGGFTNVANSSTDGTNVGIGTTGPTVSAITVYGTIAQAGGLSFTANTGTLQRFAIFPSGNNSITFQKLNSSAVLSFQNSSAVEEMRIDHGNVGIGTPSVNSILDVNGNASLGVAYSGISAPTDGLIVKGNVGIGTSAPVNPLTVGTAGLFQITANGGKIPRTNSVTSSATPSVNADTTDEFDITALATAVTSMSANLSGTFKNGQILIYRIKDNGSPQGLTWGASFASTSITLPSTTSASTTIKVIVQYDSTAAVWQCVGVA